MQHYAIIVLVQKPENHREPAKREDYRSEAPRQEPALAS
jgi:hypothetical protein